MKILFDQNISPKILNKLPSEFHACQQVRFVELENASDLEIFKYAGSHGFAIASFDSDFVDLNSLFGVPPKIIYINTGNLTTQSIADLIQNKLLNIIHYLNSETDEVLELIKS